MKRILVAVIVAALFVLPSLYLLPLLPSSRVIKADAVSYNPAPFNNFHAPLSGVGLLAEAHMGEIQPAQIPNLWTGSTPNSNVQSGSTSNSNNGGIDPANTIRFINDTSYIPQSETTIAVDPNNLNHVVGGVNDARFFFCGALPASDCPSGFALSVSGFTISKDGGASVFKGSDIPGLLVTETNQTSAASAKSGKPVTGFLLSWGDPSVAAGTDGNFYYASLAIDPVTGANGIMISESNSNLWNPSVSCVTSLSNPAANACWNAKFVFGNLAFHCTNAPQGAVCSTPTFEDKELIAVDKDSSSSFYGSVYIAWDHFFAEGTSSTYLARCTQDLSSCTMLSGGGKPAISGPDPFSAFSTPVVDSNGKVYVAWCNYGTFTTLGPISCRERSSAAGGTSFGTTNNIVSFMGQGTTLPNDNGILGYATEQFRTFSIPSIAVDTSGVSNNLYFAISVCTEGNYYGFASPALPGNCGSSSVIFSKSSNGGTAWTAPMLLTQSGSVNDQPFVTVDSVTGKVIVVYYTTSYDSFNHRIDVAASISSDQGSTFISTRVTSVSDEPNADPAMYDYFVSGGFGGSFVVPQFGDYFQAVALNGKVWVLYTGNYQMELGTFQADPFLTTFNT